MQIGLVRHFKINAPKHKHFMTSEEFMAWADNYEASGVQAPPVVQQLNHWPQCICSGSERAQQTARLLYSWDIELTDLIREVPIAPIFKTNIKLPFLFWLISGRVAWFFSHKSQPESKEVTYSRVQKFISIDLLVEDRDLLVVSHGFIMRIIKNDLIKKGFTGDQFTRAKNGTLYKYGR